MQDPSFQLHVPTLFDVEIGNILWKKIQRGELTRVEADAIIAQMPHLPLTRHAEAPLVPSGFDLASQTGRTVYDCLYLALAVQLGTEMVTADLRLFNALRGTVWAVHIRWVSEVP